MDNEHIRHKKNIMQTGNYARTLGMAKGKGRGRGKGTAKVSMPAPQEKISLNRYSEHR